MKRLEYFDRLQEGAAGFNMNWELFSLIGTIAFAASGAIVAMEEEYDIIGIYVLGLVTAFGGGVVRNLLIGIPVPTLWEQGYLLRAAIIATTLAFLLPILWIQRWKMVESFFDAIGLSAFSIQGAIYATKMGLPISAVIVAAVMTGTGGGIIRDVLAGRKPIVLRDEIYALWSILAGICIGLGWGGQPIQSIVLFSAVILTRMLSVYFKWTLPRRSLTAPDRATQKNE